MHYAYNYFLVQWFLSGVDYKLSLICIYLSLQILRNTINSLHTYTSDHLLDFFFFPFHCCHLTLFWGPWAAGQRYSYQSRTSFHHHPEVSCVFSCVQFIFLLLLDYSLMLGKCVLQKHTVWDRSWSWDSHFWDHTILKNIVEHHIWLRI